MLEPLLKYFLSNLKMSSKPKSRKIKQIPNANNPVLNQTTITIFNLI